MCEVQVWSKGLFLDGPHVQPVQVYLKLHATLITELLRLSVLK